MCNKFCNNQTYILLLFPREELCVDVEADFDIGVLLGY